MAFNMDDYVDVAARIQEFYEKYPDGRLSTAVVKFCQWPQDGIFAQAEAYRTADDPRPGVGTAWEPVPGKTSFTKDSEVQNAETAAWGRAIAAVGIKTKKIASKEEVRNRQPEPHLANSITKGYAAAESKRAAAANDETSRREGPAAKLVTPAQIKKMFAVARGYKLGDDEIKSIIKRIADVDHTKEIPRYLMDAILQEIEVYALGQPS